MEKQFFISKEQFLTMQSKWRSIKEHSSSGIIIYNILRNKDAKRGFSEKKSCEQIVDRWQGYNSALSDAKWLTDIISFPRPDRVQQKRDEFKRRFGIDMPDDIGSRLPEKQK